MLAHARAEGLVVSLDPAELAPSVLRLANVFHLRGKIVCHGTANDPNDPNIPNGPQSLETTNNPTCLSNLNSSNKLNNSIEVTATKALDSNNPNSPNDPNNPKGLTGHRWTFLSGNDPHNSDKP